MRQRRWWMLPLALALVWLLSLTPAWQRASRALLDVQLQLAWAGPTSDGVVVVDIDDASIRALQLQLGRWPYRSDTLAMLADYLLRQGARVVVLDLAPAGPHPHDGQLARLLRQGRVVLAAPVAADGGSDPDAQASHGSVRPAHWPRTESPALAVPAAAGLAAPAPLGVVAPLEGDGRLRRWPLLHEVHGRSLPALPLAALQALDPTTPLRYAEGHLQLGAHRWPLDAQARVWTPLPAGEPPLGFMRVGAAALDLIDDPALRSRLAGRIVFVGRSGPAGERSALPTTATWAAATRALRAGRVLGPPSRVLDALLLAIGVAPLLTLHRRRGDGQEGLLAAAAMLTVLMTSTLALAVYGTQSQPLAALAVAVLGYALVRALRPRRGAPAPPARAPARGNALS